MTELVPTFQCLRSQTPKSKVCSQGRNLCPSFISIYMLLSGLSSPKGLFSRCGMKGLAALKELRASGSSGDCLLLVCNLPLAASDHPRFSAKQALRFLPMSSPSPTSRMCCSEAARRRRRPLTDREVGREREVGHAARLVPEDLTPLAFLRISQTPS